MSSHNPMLAHHFSENCAPLSFVPRRSLWFKTTNGITRYDRPLQPLPHQGDYYASIRGGADDDDDDDDGWSDMDGATLRRLGFDGAGTGIFLNTHLLGQAAIVVEFSRDDNNATRRHIYNACQEINDNIEFLVLSLGFQSVTTPVSPSPPTLQESPPPEAVASTERSNLVQTAQQSSSVILPDEGQPSDPSSSGSSPELVRIPTSQIEILKQTGSRYSKIPRRKVFSPTSRRQARSRPYDIPLRERSGRPHTPPDRVSRTTQASTPFSFLNPHEMPDRPSTAASTDTTRQARVLFHGFDGVHCPPSPQQAYPYHAFMATIEYDNPELVEALNSRASHLKQPDQASSSEEEYSSAPEYQPKTKPNQASRKRVDSLYSCKVDQEHQPDTRSAPNIREKGHEDRKQSLPAPAAADPHTVGSAPSNEASREAPNLQHVPAMPSVLGPKAGESLWVRGDLLRFSKGAGSYHTHTKWRPLRNADGLSDVLNGDIDQVRKEMHRGFKHLVDNESTLRHQINEMIQKLLRHLEGNDFKLEHRINKRKQEHLERLGTNDLGLENQIRTIMQDHLQLLETNDFRLQDQIRKVARRPSCNCRPRGSFEVIFFCVFVFGLGIVAHCFIDRLPPAA